MWRGVEWGVTGVAGVAGHGESLVAFSVVEVAFWLVVGCVGF